MCRFETESVGNFYNNYVSSRGTFIGTPCISVIAGIIYWHCRECRLITEKLKKTLGTSIYLHGIYLCVSLPNQIGETFILLINWYLSCFLWSVFSIGNNSQGQCGRPIIENESYRWVVRYTVKVLHFARPFFPVNHLCPPFTRRFHFANQNIFGFTFTLFLMHLI